MQVSFERYQMICRRNVVVTRNEGQTDREWYGFTSWQSAGGAPKDRRSPRSWRLPWPANCAAGPFAAGLHGMRFQ